MAFTPIERPYQLLLIEDNPGDVRLVQEALREGTGQSRLQVAADGPTALRRLRRLSPYETEPLPDLILLDLNLPRQHGYELLDELKRDVRLRSIPVVVLTTSSHDHDVQTCYERQASCYVAKPLEIDAFLLVVRQIELFWTTIATLPGREP